jgi:DNA topoisomerase-1
MAVYLEGRDEDEAEEKEGLLPLLKEDEVLQLLSLVPKQHFTEPPKRYSEATIVKVLEQKGIGRPSTYAPTISTIQDRGYIQREGRALKPTELGMLTNEQLEKHFAVILDYAFTAKMEDELDEIVEGKVDWVKMLKEFWGPFENALKKADENMEKIKTEKKTDEVCPQCGKPVVIRQGRFGEFMACSGYPECKYTKNLAKNEEEQSTEACEKCGKPMVLKRSRYGAFWACSGYPNCKNIQSIVKKTGVNCPTCKEGEIIERKSKKGRVFYGCSRYPKCEFSSWDIPYPTPCPVCQGLMVTKQRKDMTIIQCISKECGHKIET